MSRIAIEDFGIYAEVTIGWDPSNQRFFFYCLNSIQDEDPEVWEPSIENIYLLEALLKKAGVFLPIKVKKMLLVHSKVNSIKIEGYSIREDKFMSSQKNTIAANTQEVPITRDSLIPTLNYMREHAIGSGLILPDHAQAIFANENTVWSLVELFGMESNSTVATKLILPLANISHHTTNYFQMCDTYIEMAHNFVNKFIKPKGVITEFAVHPPHDIGNLENCHWRTHILFSSCTLNRTGDRFETSQKYEIKESALAKTHPIAKYELSNRNKSKRKSSFQSLKKIFLKLFW